MSWFSNLFGRNKQGQGGEFEAAATLMVKMLEDEEFQLGMLPTEAQKLFRSKAPCDQTPGASGEFGLCASNPIPVNGPIGELAYLSKLRTLNGESLFFHRIGSVNLIDVFEATTLSGSDWFILFLDMYYPKQSRSVPVGFTISGELSRFSGFNQYCNEFPHDFVQNKTQVRDSGLSIAYMSISRAESFLNQAVYERPIEHCNQLNGVRSTLNSVHF
jgi:hypothetical protein